MGITTIATCIDYYSSVVADINDIIMLIATIFLFKCAMPLNPNPGYCHFPTTHPSTLVPPLRSPRRHVDRSSSACPSTPCRPPPRRHLADRSSMPRRLPPLLRSTPPTRPPLRFMSRVHCRGPRLHCHRGPPPPPSRSSPTAVEAHFSKYQNSKK
jgi:hypothetical protein